jgi:hypothetical protein
VQENPETDEQEADDAPEVRLGRLPDVLVTGCGLYRPWDF